MVWPWPERAKLHICFLTTLKGLLYGNIASYLYYQVTSLGWFEATLVWCNHQQKSSDVRRPRPWYLLTILCNRHYQQQKKKMLELQLCLVKWQFWQRPKLRDNKHQAYALPLVFVKCGAKLSERPCRTCSAPMLFLDNSGHVFWCFDSISLIYRFI